MQFSLSLASLCFFVCVRGAIPQASCALGGLDVFHELAAADATSVDIDGNGGGSAAVGASSAAAASAAAEAAAAAKVSLADFELMTV